MKQDYRFSTTEVLTILGSVLYPNPDDDHPGAVVWFHGRPYPWPGPIGLGLGGGIREVAGASQIDKVASIAHAAVLLHRLVGSTPSAGLASIGAVAGVLFDDYCGTVPLSEIIRRLLNRPPPPPPPWFDKLASAAMLAQLATNLQPGAVHDEIARGVEASVHGVLKSIER